jgi:dipeptidyl aminopeptidase/acylaminoacyl peptidase
MRRLLTGLVLALLATFPAVAEATWPGKAGRVTYSGLDFADEGPLDGVYTIGPRGGGNHRVIRQLDGGDVAVSRAGTRIAFTIEGRELWQVRRDGAHARRILRIRHGSLGDPAWSPTGRRLVFTRFVRRHGRDVGQVWVVRRDGKRAHKIRTGNGATWSSKNQIAFITNKEAVATVRPSGRGRRIWVPQGSPVVNLDFSPNGRRLVFAQFNSALTRFRIRTVDLRTRRRTGFAGDAMDVAWAPGGHRVAWVPNRVGDSPSVLRTARPNGKARRTAFKFPEELTPFSFAWLTR